MARPRKTTRRKPSRKRQPKRILNVNPSPKTEEDWTFETAQEADMVMAAPSIPTSKDLRSAWWKVADQGSTGSCVGWATADSVLRWHFVKNGRIAQTDLLSPRFVWMASKETDPYIARKFGVVRDAVLPFRTGRLYAGQANTFYALASQLKIFAYFNLGTNQTSWRTWLATKGPILTRLNVDDTWYASTENAGNLDDYLPDKTHGGHAVAIVGYRPGRFIVVGPQSSVCP